MASHIDTDGQVLPPLNISAPAPLINLRGFKWMTVDKAINTAQRVKDGNKDVFANGGPSSHQKPLSDGDAEAARHLPAQVEKQLGLNAVPPPQLPPFPLTKLQGPYAGNCFNTIFRPRSNASPDDADAKLTKLTFGNTIGDIPNRGMFGQPDITLTGLPYLQTIQDVTNVITGRGDRVGNDGIHFEPGMWLHVPESTVNPAIGASVARMASIPHGTTINAQGLVSKKREDTVSGGTKGGPKFDEINITPTSLSDGTPIPFPSLKSENKFPPRIPQDLEMFTKKKTITNDIILNPNLVLQKAIEGQTISETITFEVSTGPRPSIPQCGTLPSTASTKISNGSGSGTTGTSIKGSIKPASTVPNTQASPPKPSTGAPNGAGNGTTNTNVKGSAEPPVKSQEQSPKPATTSLDGGGTSNIAFLVGQTELAVEGGPKPMKIGPNANAAFMTSRFWIETVQYKVNVGLMTSRDPVKLIPTMPECSTAPTPVFLVTPPSKLPFFSKEPITIPGTQIQYSQQVNLVFAKLNWPHVSVATLVPTEPQLFTIPG
ncbi:hypothetical protein LTR56_018660 [Elasticomyces elasticus]|nr:hypothetical protein LTR56_018660 [Elasticomyces elasticus]KAK3635671.1 hypothetical protein LTR22_019098 [Elasticomyces elasticus]KAK4933115.1 hypothetical protein LTR49_000599 [Elasticomyces elasticus]KAK5764014.1 hypothetical protein LTS12_005924 [Elasticomyces elasticus]